ncbi:hypothetical protein BGX27_001814 [Mortierella sp. AM989]|nr:hypothetical protein BGX27_001814 [Mortierella sp. AM989]
MDQPLPSQIKAPMYHTHLTINIGASGNAADSNAIKSIQKFQHVDYNRFDPPKASKEIEHSVSWLITRPYSAQVWEKIRITVRQSYHYPQELYNSQLSNMRRQLNKWQDALPVVALNSRLSRSRSPIIWILSLFLVVAVAAAQQSVLNIPKVIAYDPMVPVADQLKIPVVAGAPPSPPVQTEPEKQKEYAYIQRQENDRVRLQGSLYVELTPEDIKQMKASQGGDIPSGPPNFIRYSKEPLPWEGLEIDTQNGGEIPQDDDYTTLGWPYSPWEGEFRYEAMPDDNGYNDVDLGEDESREVESEDTCRDDRLDDGNSKNKQKEKGGLQKSLRRHHHHRYSCHRSQQLQHQKEPPVTPINVGNDSQAKDQVKVTYAKIINSNPSINSDDKVDKLDVAEALPSLLDEESEIFQIERIDEFGASAANDPNVIDNINEVVDPQVWDALEPPQKSRPRTQQYVESDRREGGKSRSPESSYGAKSAKRVKKLEFEPGAETDDETIWPKFDQIDILGHEAEVDWLNEQGLIQKEAYRKHNRQRGRFEGGKGNEEAEDEDEDENTDDENKDKSRDNGNSDEDNDADTHEDDEKEIIREQNKSPEELYNDPLWHKKHGGLNPKHFHPDNTVEWVEQKMTSRAEKQDRDEDGVVFPDTYSSEPYSQLIFPSVSGDPRSTLGYIAYNYQGDRIMDFSMVGWNEGNTNLPDPTKDVPVLERLFPRDGSDSDSDQGDDTSRIQKALDRVSDITAQNTLSKDVIPRGALVLEKGVYRISKPLKIRASGILFRGDPAGGSRIVCQWESTGPRYAVEIEGKKDIILDDTNIPVIADYTPVGSFFLTLDPTYFEDVELAVGDQVILTRVGNDRWVEDIGMDDFDSNKKGVKPWKKMLGRMYRTIRSLNSQTGIVQLDAPLPISIWRGYGGAYVTKYQDNKIRALGVQFLDMVFPNNIGRTVEDMLDERGRGSTDYRFSFEIFANYALRVDLACHMYISHITSAFFHNFISIGTDVHHVTMDSIVHSYPDEMLSGQSAFQLSGQLVLIKNTLSQGSFHFFVDINHVMGPNVFHRTQGTNVGKPYQPIPLDFAPGEVGPHMKFCTGILVDQVVTDGSIQIVNRGDMGTGQGYSGANSVVWNSRAREGILTHRATGFQNFVIGSEDFDAEDRHPWDSHGWKEHVGSEVLPGSLYLRQLSDRLDRLSKGWLA